MKSRQIGFDIQYANGPYENEFVFIKENGEVFIAETKDYFPVFLLKRRAEDAIENAKTIQHPKERYEFKIVSIFF